MSGVRFKAFGVDIRVSFWFFAVITAFFVFGRGTLALYFILPVIIHELGHFIVMLLCGIKAEAVNFTAFSIDIRRGSAATASYTKDIAISLGGVAANLLTAACLFLFAFQSMRVMLFIAVNAAIALFNIMPVGNLDGGEVLRLILEQTGNPGFALKVSRIFSFIILIPLFAVSIFMVLRDFANVSLLIACVYLTCVVITSI